MVNFSLSTTILPGVFTPVPSLLIRLAWTQNKSVPFEVTVISRSAISMIGLRSLGILSF
jgi:hypothetical protein